MGAPLVHERLRQARLSAGEPLRTLAQRTGVREPLLRTIEDGCFSRLPPGIYARAAIRSYAVAVGLDPVEVLDACAGDLPAVEEPISGLNRLHGKAVPPVSPSPAPAPPVIASPQSGSPRFSWRPLAAAAVDAAVIATFLAGLIVCVRFATAVPLAALGSPAAAAFAAMGVLFGVSYFVWIGGLTGATAGERVAGLASPNDGTARATLPVIAARAWRAATEDARGLAAAGAWIGSASGHSRRTPDAGVAAANGSRRPTLPTRERLQALVGPSPVFDRCGRGPGRHAG